MFCVFGWFGILGFSVLGITGEQQSALSGASNDIELVNERMSWDFCSSGFLYQWKMFANFSHSNKN